MNDSPSKIALIQSRLPYTERGALSEAWFSALHLASDGPPARDVPERRGAACAREPAREASADARVDTRSVVAVCPLTRTSRPPAHPSSTEAPRSRERTSLERAAHKLTRGKPPNDVARSYASFRTSLTIGLDKERVQLLLRREGATLHVVAICRPQVADTVRRALALADAHLRIRGEAVRSSVTSFTDAEAGA